MRSTARTSLSHVEQTVVPSGFAEPQCGQIIDVTRFQILAHRRADDLPLLLLAELLANLREELGIEHRLLQTGFGGSVESRHHQFQNHRRRRRSEVENHPGSPVQLGKVGERFRINGPGLVRSLWLFDPSG